MRLCSDHVFYKQIKNPTEQQQLEFILEHFGYVPEDYKIIPINQSGIIHVFKNSRLNECWIGTFHIIKGKMKDWYEKSKTYRRK